MKTVRIRVSVAPVRGHSFPIDMLRYDACFPETETDAANIARSMRGEGNVTISLVHVGEKSWKPHAGRWESFGWCVVGAEVYS